MTDSLDKTIDLKDWSPDREGELQILAESHRNHPVSAVLRKGRGFCLLLPWFGEKNIEVAGLILGQVLPETSPWLFAGEKSDWIDSPEYSFPGLLEVYEQMEEEKERHMKALIRFQEKIAELKLTEQEAFIKLLVAQDEELRKALTNVFKYLEWLNVIDVVQYWKHVIRIKEEDLWLLDEDEKSVEELIRGAELILVEVKGGLEGASDEDCFQLQRYKGRRMQEFNNTRMKALLVGNYYYKTEAKLRGIPFTEKQTNEATKDGNGLLTTYELFKAIKAEKQNKITKEEIREQIKKKVGLITFDY